LAWGEVCEETCVSLSEARGLLFAVSVAGFDAALPRRGGPLSSSSTRVAPTTERLLLEGGSLTLTGVPVFESDT
jgi:hypothetical protein